MSSLYVPARELDIVRDHVFTEEIDGITVFRRRDITLDPLQFVRLLVDEEPGVTIQPRKGRFVIRALHSEIGMLVSKRFHYHRTYRRKQRLFMGYRFQNAHGPVQFIRSLHAHLKGHNVVEPILAMRRTSGRFRQESLLLTRRADGISLRDFFLDAGRDFDVKLDLFGRGLYGLKAMHDDGIAFGDAQTRHQILDERGRLWWLDFDKMVITRTGISHRDRDLRRFFSSGVLRISQSGRDFEDTFQQMLSVFDEVYPLPVLWRRILLTEVRRRVGRMLRRRGFRV